MDLFEFLHEMGGMHGAVISSFTWTPDAREIEFRIEDMYGNFRGMPEYPGQRSGSVTLYGVSDVSVAVKENMPLRVFEFFPEAGSSDVVLITFWPAGWIRARFKAAEYSPSLPAARIDLSRQRDSGHSRRSGS